MQTPEPKVAVVGAIDNIDSSKLSEVIATELARQIGGDFASALHRFERVPQESLMTETLLITFAVKDKNSLARLHVNEIS